MELEETVMIVSTPRSGLHFLAKNIEYLAPSQAVFCEGYSCVDSNRKVINNCPNQFSNSLRLSCASGRRIVKNHDFGLDLDLSQYKKVLVLRRRNWYALLASWYLGAVKYRWDQLPAEKVSFETFALTKMEYLFDFNQKYDKLNSLRIKHLYFEDFHLPKGKGVEMNKIYEFIFDESPKEVRERSRNTLRQQKNIFELPFFRQDFYEYVNLMATQSEHMSNVEFKRNLRDNFHRLKGHRLIQ
jgi:hypothetical protein